MLIESGFARGYIGIPTPYFPAYPRGVTILPRWM